MIGCVWKVLANASGKVKRGIYLGSLITFKHPIPKSFRIARDRHQKERHTHSQPHWRNHSHLIRDGKGFLSYTTYSISLCPAWVSMSWRGVETKMRSVRSNLCIYLLYLIYIHIIYIYDVIFFYPCLIYNLFIFCIYSIIIPKYLF